VLFGSWTFAMPAALLISAGAPPSMEPPVSTGSPTVMHADPGGEQPSTVTAPASVEAFFTTDLYAKDSGYVSRLNADIGDHVQEGQLLAVIEDPETHAQYDRALAGVQQAKAALEVAKRQLIGLQADRTLQLLTFRRQKELFAGKAATAQALDEANAKDQASEANAETGKAKIASAEADLQAAEAESQRLQALLQYTRIAAPFTGVVTRRLVNPGDLVQAATGTRTVPLFTVQQLNTVRVFADVPEASAVDIRPGWTAAVKLDETPGQVVHGAVTRVASALDSATRTMRVEIDLPNRDEKLLPGMYAQVTLEPIAVVTNAPGRPKT
jgi:multidrug efflux pump subunit AcrA (membrane-fusion protein)